MALSVSSGRFDSPTRSAPKRTAFLYPISKDTDPDHSRLIVSTTRPTIRLSAKNVVAFPRAPPLHCANNMHLPALRLFVVVAAFTTISASAFAADVVNTTRYHDDTLGITLLSGETRLPADGNWTLAQPPADSGLRQVFYDVTNWEALHADGARSLANRIDEKVRSDRWTLTRHQYVLGNYAKQNNGRGPSRWDDPALLELVANHGHPRNPNHTALLPTTQAELIKSFREASSDVALVPDADMTPVNNGDTPTPSPLLLELTPALDDGQHWVLYTDNTTQRVPIDAGLLKKLGLTVSKKDVLDDVLPPRPTEQVVQLHAISAPSAHRSARLVFTDAVSGRTVTVNWDWSRTSAGTRAQLSSWAGLRAAEWTSFDDLGDAPLLSTWLDIAPELYGAEIHRNERRRMNNNQTPPSFLALFGGRAAVQETLQLQPLANNNPAARTASSAPTAKTVPMDQITGVTVKSHPYAEMARGKSLPSLPLAEFVPPDRAFFYAAQPSALNQLFAPDSAFVRRIGALAAPGLDYDLRERYSAELGLTPALVNTILDSGLVTECAVFTPDLFFADGTDLTVIARVRSGALLSKLLKPILSPLASHDGVYTLPTANNGSAHWAIKGDLWFLSNHAQELKSTLALSAKKGAGSLGVGDEFRYMLHKLPPTADTRAYVYLSDAFIRRLVGPAVKIAQTRRINARLAMERLVGAALLRQLDVPGANTTAESLASLGYLKSADLSPDLALNAADHSATSTAFGPLAGMKPLSAQASTITHATPDEADAYARYLENYTRFWSRFFDPIALRLDASAKGDHTLTTFILPLVENSAYNALRTWLPVEASAHPNAVTPVFNRTPVAQLDLVLPDKTWRAIAGGSTDLFQNYLGVSPEFYDLLGPSLHVAIEDGDPVLRLGSGELASVFSPVGGGGAGMDRAMLYIPVILNLLTRPTHIALELTDSERAARLLDNAFPMGDNGPDSFMRVELFRQGNAREWLLSFRPLGVAAIDFSLRIDGRYLVISNHPWGEPLRVTGVRPARLGGAALTFNPQARTAGLPADFVSAMRTERTRALIGMGHVYPWMLALNQTPEAAAAANARVLGFTPSIPAGNLDWKESVLEHAVFGNIWNARLPAYAPSVRFGLFENLSDATVSMQFEDDGLRTELSWRLLTPPAVTP